MIYYHDQAIAIGELEWKKSASLIMFNSSLLYNFSSWIGFREGAIRLWTNWDLVSTISIWFGICRRLINSIWSFSSEEAGDKLLKDLAQINRPLKIKFKEMLNLMSQCDIVDRQNRKRVDSRSVPHSEVVVTANAKPQFKNNPFALFSGIIPGTKWCGTGDIATTYSDLGE